MNWEQPKVYAVKHKDEDIRASSRSGGIFTALSDEILSKGGIVYGCVLNEKFNAIHIRTDNSADRNRMRGSKYIQSKMGDTLRNVKEDLNSGYQVLFTGTSCQVAGLKSFLGVDYENLICVDIVCHGVPSKKVWNSYLNWQEEMHHSKIIAVDFRNKKDFGWRDHVESIYFENGQTCSMRVFRSMFYTHTILRPSCYECPYKSVMHPGDITIADYWGIEKVAPEFDDNKGVSLVLVNSEHGEMLLTQVNKKIIKKQTKLEDSMQPALKKPYSKPKDRDEFWQDFYNKSFSFLAKRYGNYGIKNEIKYYLRRTKMKMKEILK